MRRFTRVAVAAALLGMTAGCGATAASSKPPARKPGHAGIFSALPSACTLVNPQTLKTLGLQAKRVEQTNAQQTGVREQTCAWGSPVGGHDGTRSLILIADLFTAGHWRGPGRGGERPLPAEQLWWSQASALPDDVDQCWQAFLRRFDLEHTFRLFKQVLGWTAPKIRDPAAAGRWTWLIIAAHTQLRLARPLAADLRRPWERPAPPGRLTPARVRRGFRNIRAKTAQPAGAPKPGKPGPGRPPGSKNRRPAPRHDVGKTTKRELTLKARRERAG